MRTLSDMIQEECSGVIESRFGGALTYASLSVTDDGVYAYPFLTDDGVQNHVLSDDVQRALDEATAALEERVEVQGDRELDTRISVTWVPENDSVYVGKNFVWERETMEDAFEYVSEVAAQGSPNVEQSRVTSMECTLSLYPHEHCDGTVSFRTDNPHERIGNVDSFEEYVEWRAENSGKTEEEIRAQDDYLDHYHPSDYDTLSDVCEFLTAPYYDDITIREPVRKAATGGELAAGGEMSGKVHVFARVGELIDF